MAAEPRGGYTARSETDARPVTPPSNGVRSRASLPDYMSDADLAALRDEHVRGQPQRNNPIAQSEHSRPLVVRQLHNPVPHSNHNDVYRMTSRPKGLFLLINNIHFNSSDTRDGAKKDQENLMNLFRKLGYRVECFQDQTLQDMRTKIIQFARRPELLRVDSVFVAITSHGQGSKVRDTQIISRDDLPLDCQWVVDQFNTINSPGMRYKPKVFLFQLCRGERCEYTGKMYEATQTDGNSQSDPCRLNDDVLVANATVQGFTAQRHREWGSWFVQAICKVYSQHACEDDIETMHRKVDTLVKQCISDDHTHPAKQTCTYRNQGFNKKFYFYPGVYRNRDPPQMAA